MLCSHVCNNKWRACIDKYRDQLIVPTKIFKSLAMVMEPDMASVPAYLMITTGPNASIFYALLVYSQPYWLRLLKEIRDSQAIFSRIDDGALTGKALFSYTHPAASCYLEVKLTTNFLFPYKCIEFGPGQFPLSAITQVSFSSIIGKHRVSFGFNLLKQDVSL